jgi:hypothetical protein
MVPGKLINNKVDNLNWLQPLEALQGRAICAFKLAYPCLGQYIEKNANECETKETLLD